MFNNTNEVIRKFLGKISKTSITKEKYYDSISDVEIVFVINSSNKSNNCDWIYGIKIIKRTDTLSSQNDPIIKDLTTDIRKQTDHFFKQRICCTDIYFD